jgi:hypothetical protein
MNNILIAVNPKVSSDVEEYLESLQYTKEVKHNAHNYVFEYPDWEIEHDDFPAVFMTFLITELGYDNFAFVRLGEEPDDIEVHGDLDSYNVTVTRIVSTDE